MQNKPTTSKKILGFLAWITIWLIFVFIAKNLFEIKAAELLMAWGALAYILSQYAEKLVLES